MLKRQKTYYPATAGVRNTNRRSGRFTTCLSVPGLGDMEGARAGSAVKKALLMVTGIAATGLVIFSVIVGTTAYLRNRSLPAPLPAVAETVKELPPALLNENWGEWDKYFVFQGVDKGEGLIADPAWNSFVARSIETHRHADGSPSIIEKVLPPGASHETTMDVFALYSYIREVNPGVNADTALVEACSMHYYAGKTTLPISLVVGVAQTESNFRPSAVSTANARGVMQVMWKYHWAVLQANGIKEEKFLHDPEMGIAAGAIVLSRYLKQEQSIPGALGRYYGVLSNKYVGITLSYKHAFEMYTSGISQSWKNSIARERHYWNRMTGGKEAIAAKVAPKLPGENGDLGASVVVSVVPNPATTPSVMPVRGGSGGASSGASKPSSASAKSSGTTIVGAGGGSHAQTSTQGRKGNIITVVYRNGDKTTWQE